MKPEQVREGVIIIWGIYNKYLNHNQEYWHCQTAHCLAGWIQHIDLCKAVGINPNEVTSSIYEEVGSIINNDAAVQIACKRANHYVAEKWNACTYSVCDALFSSCVELKQMLVCFYFMYKNPDLNLLDGYIHADHFFSKALDFIRLDCKIKEIPNTDKLLELFPSEWQSKEALFNLMMPIDK